jgi:hypothetical protein
MEIILLFFWLIAAFFIGFLGTNKTIGYWGAFFLSFLCSPLVGIIAALVSGTSTKAKPSTKYLQYRDDIEKGKMAENRGDYSEAVKHYKDALYRIDNAPKINEYAKIKYMADRKKEIIERLLVISKL